MGFYRIYPTKDTFITNRMFNTTNSLRATGSNFGLCPSLNVFKLTASVPTSEVELSRILMDFNITELSGKIYTDQTIPSSSVSYVLKMFNMEHDERTPADNFELFAFPVSQSWSEGKGIDNQKYRDFGYANWLSASSTSGWISGSTAITGASYIASTEYGSGSQLFDTDFGNLEMDITDIVVNWLTGTLNPNGLIVKLGDTEEGNATDYYNKIFHGRETQFVEKMPYIEARWNSDVRKDNRNNFGYDVENKLFMYNFIRGELTSPGETLTCRIQDHLIGVSASYTGSFSTYEIESGILTASITIELTGNARFSSSFYDIWESSNKVYMSGTFNPLILTGSNVDPYSEFVVDVTNLKPVYQTFEEARIKVNVRKRDYKTHRIIHTASLGMDREYIEKMYYQIENDETGDVIVPYGTGSVSYTQLSYNGDGNYFNIWMSSFVPGFKYRIRFLIDINKYDKKEVDDDFTFKVM